MWGVSAALVRGRGCGAGPWPVRLQQVWKDHPASRCRVIIGQLVLHSHHCPPMQGSGRPGHFLAISLPCRACHYCCRRLGNKLFCGRGSGAHQAKRIAGTGTECGWAAQ